MKTLGWNRSAVIQHLRDDVWRYVTQASEQYHPIPFSEDDLLLRASALLQMPAAEVRYLAQLDFIRSNCVRELLEEMPSLIRRLTPTTASETEMSTQRIRGSIRWSETYAQRAATGMPHLFVTTPTRRAFNTPENQVLVFALFAIAEFGRRTGWHRGASTGPAREVRDRVVEATRWLQARQLVGVPVQPPTPTTLGRVRNGRAQLRYRKALEVVDLYQRYIARLDRDAVRDAVERRALIASRDSVLLELHCAFDTIKTLRRLGWIAPRAGLLSPPVIFRGERGETKLEIFYQAAPRALSVKSIYREVQTSHGFSSTGGLIPDLVIKTFANGETRWLLIEVKGGEQRSVADSARAAVRDLLGYRRAFSAVLDRQTEPYGLGYAWGEGLTPSLDSDVTLCTPDTFSAALALLIPARSWPELPPEDVHGHDTNENDRDESGMHLTWRKVPPPENYKEAYEAAYKAVTFRAIHSVSGDSWRLECTYGDIDYDSGGISHETTFQACKQRAVREITQGKWVE